MHRQPFSCVDDCLRVWVTVFMHGRLSSCMAVISMHRQSFLCMGGRLDAWVVVGVGGVIVARGVVVLWFSWEDSGRVGGAYRVEEQRRTMNFHLSLVFRLPHHGQWCGTMLRVLRLCAEVVMAVWSARWQAWCLAMDGESRSRQAMCVDDGGYMERLGLGFGQNSHSWNWHRF